MAFWQLAGFPSQVASDKTHSAILHYHFFVQTGAIAHHLREIIIITLLYGDRNLFLSKRRIQENRIQEMSLSHA